MIIRHMQGTFGTLDGEQLRLDTGLNIIYAPNESGKSTWCAFLRAMLYGIDTSQRARAGFVPDKQKYAPWSGKPMAGELELEQDGKCITIRRWTEAKSAPMRAFSAVYTGTDIPVPGLTANDAGEQLTGVSAEVFQRSAFIGQGGLVVTGTPELEKRISAIVTSGEEASSYTEADAQLRAWLRRRRSGQHGALPELEQRIADTETQLHRLERNAQEQAACAAELRETESELQTVTDQMNAARQRQRRAALSSMGEEKSNLRTLEQALEQARRDAAAKRTALEQTHFGVQTPDEAGETAERDAQRAQALSDTAAHGGKPYFWIAALVLAALCAVLGYLVAQPLYYAAIALAAAALVLLIVAANGRQRAQQASFVPTEYNNIALDSEGFFFVTTQTFNSNELTSGAAKPVRRLNAIGTNILIENGTSHVIGDLQWARGDTNITNSGPSKFVDVTVLDNDIYSVMDKTHNRIFTYDKQGNLLWAFGGVGNMDGYFLNPVALEHQGYDLLVLDSQDCCVTVLTPTEYGKLVYKATEQYHAGEYAASADTWREVMKRNGNYDLAYIGIGRALLQQKQFKEACDYFAMARDSRNYSEAFRYYRSEWVEQNIGWIFGIVAVLLVVPMVIGHIRKIKWEVDNA